ncbi:hypothetical protein HDV04_000313 [Boothiomyces sp. JEL0838]|nr:hypothetical protein HDV04_000313 [Boothiomyces sp. JEL0838]
MICQLPPEILYAIMDYVEGPDLLFWSLTNRLFYQKLSLFRKLHNLKVIKFWPSLHLYCDPSSKYYFMYPDSDKDNRKLLIQLFDIFDHCPFIFHHVYIGSQMFIKVADRLPRNKYLHLVIESNTDYEELGNVLEKDLVSHIFINEYFEDNETMIILRHMQKLKRLNTLELDYYLPYGGGYDDETDIDSKILKDLIPHSSIKQLSLVERCVSEYGASLLASQLQFTLITKLDLTGNCIKDQGAIAIAKELPRTFIIDLKLGSNHITGQGATAIAEVLHQSSVIELNLSSNEISSTGLKSLAGSLKKSKLRRLFIYDNQFSTDQLYILFENLPGSQIEYLSFSEFKDQRTIDSFNANLWKSNLKTIHYQTATNGLEELLESACKSKLEIMSIQGSEIKYGDEEAVIIGNYINKLPIHTLNLHNSTMSTNGLKFLFKNLTSKTLKTLRINQREYDRFDSAGIHEVFKHLGHTHLTNLSIEGTALDDEFLCGIADGIIGSRLRQLSLSRNAGFTVQGILNFTKLMLKSKLSILLFDYCIQQKAVDDESKKKLREILFGSNLHFRGLFINK